MRNQGLFFLIKNRTYVLVFIPNKQPTGPRPGLWNQDLLIAERDKYGANDVKPGLTGWAQINGRDELEIQEKAKLDGEYVSKIGIVMDFKCFLGSIHVLGKDKSVVEGGTGKVKKKNETRICRHYTDGKTDEELIGHIGFGDAVEIDKSLVKHVLIVGANSYIGDSFMAYAAEKYPLLKVETVDTANGNGLWQNMEFSKYDIIYHLAGIAHSESGNVDDTVKEKYYSVNKRFRVHTSESLHAKTFMEFIALIIWSRLYACLKE